MAHETFTIPIRIYWEDTDAGGIVYHANYLRYMERARSDMLRHLGFDQNVMIRDHAAQLVVANLEIAYRKPAKLDDLLTVHSCLKQVRNASVIFEQIIRRGDEVITTASVRCAALDPVTGNPKIFPKATIDAFAPYIKSEE